MGKPWQMGALITGVAGFVSSHVADHLLGLGADVYDIDLKPRDDGAHSGNDIAGYSSGIYRMTHLAASKAAQEMVAMQCELDDFSKMRIRLVEREGTQDAQRNDLR